MITSNSSIINISRVIYLKTKKNPGDVTFYKQDGGLTTHELVYRVKGAVDSHFDGEILHHTKSTILFMPKGKGDKEYKVKTVETGECIDIFFDTDIPISDTPFCVDCDEDRELRTLFLEINKIWFRKDSGYYYRAMNILYKILWLLHTRTSRESFYNPYYKKIKPAVEYINKHYYLNEIDYNHIADMCGISYVYFRRLFTECMGVSPSKYVTNKKIEYAKELIASGKYKITEVAEITGFCDVYYFSRVFKKLVGSSPLSYEQSIK